VRVQPTSTRGKRTRASIADAALRVFLEHGYANATAALITTAAGVSYGSFYVYFASKDELFREVAAELMERVYLESRAPRDLVDPRSRLAHENRRFLELYRENAGVFRLIEEAIWSDETFRDYWRGVHRKYIRRTERSLRRLQSEGLMDRSLNPRYVAESLGAMAERLAYVSTVDESVNIEKVLETLSALWSRMLGLEQPR
jgi:AcrR family transcriptional regulator